MSGTRVAFIGLGAMGMPMARRLAGDAAMTVTAYDVSERALRAADFAGPADSVAAAVAGADVICTMLPADPHVDAVGAEIAGAAEAGQTYIDFSTVSPAAIARAAERLGPRGVGVVGAGCMKSVAAAEAGELSLFVGGDRDAVRGAAPLFDLLAADCLDVGSARAAKALKIVNNLLVAATGYCVCDALVVGAGLGASAARTVEALPDQGGDSWALRNQIVKHVLSDDLRSQIFNLNFMAKDVGLAVAMAVESRRPSLFAGLVAAAYRGAAALGYGEHYHPAVIRWIEHTSEVPSILDPPSAGLEEAALDTLCAGVTAALVLVNQECIELAGAEVDEQLAIDALLTGSAESDVLRRIATSGPPPTDDLLAAIAAARELAAARSRPALSLELALQLGAGRDPV